MGQYAAGICVQLILAMEYVQDNQRMPFIYACYSGFMA